MTLSLLETAALWVLIVSCLLSLPRLLLGPAMTDRVAAWMLMSFHLGLGCAALAVVRQDGAYVLAAIGVIGAAMVAAALFVRCGGAGPGEE